MRVWWGAGGCLCACVLVGENVRAWLCVGGWVGNGGDGEQACLHACILAGSSS